MGMSIDAMLIYGLPYSEIPEELIEQVDEMLDEGTLDYASPWYDSSREDWIVGVEVKVNEFNYLDSSGWSLDEHLPGFMSSSSGIECKFYVSPHVT